MPATTHAPRFRYLGSDEPKHAQRALTACHPTWRPQRVELTEQGADNHSFIVDGRTIVRFARSGDERLVSEWAVLKLLQGRLPLPIPAPRWFGQTPLHLGYPLLPGLRLVDLWPTLGETERRLVLGSLSRFLVQLHRPVIAEAARAASVPLAARHWSLPHTLSAVVEASGGAPWAGFARRCLRRYGRYLREQPDALVHQDVHGGNVLLDPGTRQVSAVLDFGDSGLGDVHRDFFPIGWMGLGAIETLAEAYEAAGGRALDRQRPLDYFAVVNLEALRDNWLDDPTPFVDRLMRLAELER